MEPVSFEALKRFSVCKSSVLELCCFNILIVLIISDTSPKSLTESADAKRKIEIRK